MAKSPKLTTIALLLGLGVSAFFPVSSALAHHSFAIYNLDEKVEITGTLTKLQFRNPHIMLALEVEGEEETIVWEIESMNPRRWDAAGVPRDLAEVGDIVTITGWAAVNGGATMALSAVKSPKGETIVRDEIRQGQAGSRSSNRGHSRQSR